ncbi:MAG: gamma-glutamyl-gamma-aminobutyrate hydrolase family protein [Candidatus Riflebacteria bacterium]|nr:gamma-glutamyl-gamma-aminobutyrate hydrolase family protein [Candidatus Riflebacteria bacterium]
MKNPKKTPLIGMTYSDMPERDEQMKVRTFCGRAYYSALQAAGSRVILLPPVSQNSEMENYLEMIDGLFLPGGEDIDPRYYNTEPSPKLGGTNPFRDSYEIEMAKLAFERKIPVFGICRGIQVMAISLGGAIYQDLPSDGDFIQHLQLSPRWATSHKVTCQTDSRCAKWMGTRAVFVNSFHHQAVKKLPKTLKAVGQTGDKLIEALESSDDRIFVGVQWHPEELCFLEESARALFKGFVDEVASKIS